MDGSFYKNLAMTVFDVPVSGMTPAQILYQFRANSPVFRDSPISDYVDFMVTVNGAPTKEAGENFESWAVRAFDYFVTENIVTFNGSSVKH